MTRSSRFSLVTRSCAVGVGAALAAVLVAGYVVVGSGIASARAEDKPGSAPAPGKLGESGKADPKADPKKDDAAKDDAAKDDAAKDEAAKDVVRQERAKRLVQELEVALVAAKSAKVPDLELVKTLDKALESARKLAEPIKLNELTAEEKKSLAEEMRKAAEGEKKDGGPATGDPGNEWQQNALARALEGADLSEEEQIKTQEVIGDWFSQTQLARTASDSKKVSDLKRDRDDKLEKLLGRKKSQKVINNLNGMSNWGGRGR